MNTSYDDTLMIDPPGTMPFDGRQGGSRIVGDYELLEEVARGGMGVVYRARQRSLDRVVAVKMILAGELASRETVERFRGEAEAVARLDHPGIVPIHEVGAFEGRHFFSMGYVEGQSLAAHLARGPIPPRDAATMVRDIAEAVQHAHDHGVIHRDLKPSNIMVDRSGRVKLLDFGIAKVLGGQGGAAKEDLTATARHPLTPRYASPEQVLGRRLSTATDIYSLGVVLYEMLTGGYPYELESKSPAEVIHTISSVTPIRPSRRVAHHESRRLAGDLDGILLKALHKDPARRYVTAEEFAADLRHHLTGLPVLARPDTAT